MKSRQKEGFERCGCTDLTTDEKDEIKKSQHAKTLKSENRESAASTHCLIGCDSYDVESNSSTLYEMLSKLKAFVWLKESLDFLPLESVMWRKHQLDRRHSLAKVLCYTKISSQTKALHWVLVVTTGVLTGLVGCFVLFMNHYLTYWKFEVCHELMHHNKLLEAYFAFLGFCVSFVIVAWLCCWKHPEAAGSGVPEIKALLNGVNLKEFATFPVLVTKIISTIFACASGLPLGPEAPMVHCGSMIGGLVSHGQTVSVFDKKKGNQWERYQDFRKDSTHRDFVTYGAAAGFAAAFRAPIGGLLFTLEEGASFWSLSHTFQCFICGMSTLLIVHIVFMDDTQNHSDMFAFGQIDNIMPNKHNNYYLYELPIFLCIGVIGGIFGALYNYILRILISWRQRNIAGHDWMRILEVVIVAALFTSASFWVPYAWTKCTPIPTDTNDEWSSTEEHLIHELVQFQCPDGYYNELASLLFTSAEVALKQLFHFREVNGEGATSFTTGPLIIFFLVYYFLATLVPGTVIPFGFFIPTLLSGSIVGRLIGHWLNDGFPGYVAPSGTYAFIGGAAFLGGASRFMIAGSLILLEASGNLSYLLPLMITFASARYVGNLINAPIYEMLIDLKRLPFLNETLKNIGSIPDLPLSYVMTTDVVTLCEVETVDRVKELLTTTKHNCFPVVGRKDGRFKGTVLRKVLCSLLHNDVVCRRVYFSGKSGAKCSPLTPKSCHNVLVSTEATTHSDDHTLSIDPVKTKMVNGKCHTTDASQQQQQQTLVNRATRGKHSSGCVIETSGAAITQRHSISLQRLMSDLTYAELARVHPDYPTTASVTTVLDGDGAVSEKEESARVNTASGSDDNVDASGVGNGLELTEIKVQQQPPSNQQRRRSPQRSVRRERLYLDLRTQMDTSPQIAMKDSSVRKSYQTFRTLGMRHLIVVNHDFTVAGIVTRADLHHKRLSALWEEVGEEMERSAMNDIRAACSDRALDDIEWDDSDDDDDDDGEGGDSVSDGCSGDDDGCAGENDIISDKHDCNGCQDNSVVVSGSNSATTGGRLNGHNGNATSHHIQ